MLNFLKKFIFQSKHTQKCDSYYLPNYTCQIKRLDWIYEKYFGLINNGTFVEVGAFDGEYVSNTSFLSDLGWYGHYIEPIPEYFNKCSLRHSKNNNIRVHDLAIGSNEGQVNINVSGVLSSINKDVTDKFKQLSWAKSLITNKTINVRQITLNKFLETNELKSGFDLLSIDVEGYELNVLKGFDIDFWQPKMVIIELHDQNFDYKDMWQDMEAIVQYMENSDYRVVYKDFTNTVYVKINEK